MSSNLPSLSDYIRGLPKTISQLKTEPLTKVTVVMGNESCDLDSAVSALTLAHHFSASCLALPMLNIPQDDVALHSEVVYCIGKDLIRCVPTRSDLDLSTLGDLKLVLVDHHVMLKQDHGLRLRINEVIDHRHFDGEAAALPEDCPTRIELVGSCSTLVGERLFSENYQDAFGLELIRNTIITDTVNLSPDAKKVTPLDVSVLERIEATLAKSSLSPRSAIFSSVKDAKCSIEGLTVDQLFRKDLKVVAFPNEIMAAVPSTLRLAIDILNEDKITQTFEDFCLQREMDILIIIGKDRGVRDLLLYATRNGGEKCQKRITRISEALLARSEIGLQVTQKLPNMIHLNQGVRAFTRKRLLPIMQSVSDHS